ncbi:hypothetical protein IZ6_19000 [Terrihabitans soli]|uniref:Uncharacterized protein n=1 Tax=Terrihabitans soli TaxID=708113 RepID=A0A6S6QUC1_9HYPH|nr:hypothetical protein [Terrihabitans soli]BCJ91165.1 hypothetical protein IZ6_19000 [Terrihabitans soli]
MTSSSLAPLVSTLRQKRDARPQDVLALRLAVFDDATVSQTDAEALMALDECMSQPCPEWRAFFVEALTDFIVQQEQPRGYVDSANARWLMNRITRDATVKPNELELLVRVMETAVSVPPELHKFTLKQVRHAVLFGDSRNTVTEHEVEILRRTLFASAGEGSIAITRDEAEILFDIANATKDSDNAASWADFFAKAVANLLMAAKGYTAPSREIALRRGRWLNDQSVDPMSFTARVLASLSNGLLANYSLPDNTPSADTSGHEIITASEAEWLSAQVKKDGMLSEIEKIMLERIRTEASNLHPTLQPLFEWAA